MTITARVLPSVLLILSLLGCTREEPLPDTLVVQYATEPVSLDPMLAEDGGALRILANVMEGLVGYDGGGALQNRLAQAFTISPDGKKYTFELRPQARWSDGIPVSAAQFIAGFRRSLSSASKAKLAPMLAPIKGFGTEKLGIQELDGKLVIELTYPSPYFIHALTLPLAYPIRDDVLARSGNQWPADAPSTGPYRIAKYLPDRKYILERNPYYYGRSSGPASVHWMTVADEATALHLFDRGQIDILTRVPAVDRRRLEQKGLVRSDPFLATYYIAFNVTRPPFNNRLWRRAVSASVARRELTTLLETGDRPAFGWIPPGLEGYDPTPFTPKEFEQALRFAKTHPPGSPVGAAFDSSHRNSTVLQKIQHDLAQILGLTLSLEQLDWKSYIRLLQTDPPPIYRFGWQAPFADPLPHLLAFTSDDPNNYSRWKNGKYDRLVRQIAGLPPGTERAKKIRQAQRILVVEEAAVVPIFHYTQNHAVSARVERFRVNPFGMIRFDELRLK